MPENMGNWTFSPSRIAGSTRLERTASAFGLVLFTVVWTWWALADGAFFGNVMYPGGILLYLGLATLLGFAPVRVRGGGLHELAFLSLVALALWTIVSFAWTPARDLALEDAQRTLIYAASFAGGLWVATLLGRRLALALLPLAVACAAVCFAIVVVGAGAADAGALLDGESTLDFPFGYRNATAALLVIAFFVGVVVAARDRGSTALRCGGTGLAATAASLTLLSQSRGSVLGAVAGVIALVAVSPVRSRALLALGVALLPAALTIPWMLEPFSVAGEGGDVDGALRTAAIFAVAAGAAGAVLTLGMLRIEPTGERVDRAERAVRRGLIVTLGIVAVAIPLGLLATSTNPITWVDDQIQSSKTDEQAPGSSRFAFTGGLERSNFWSVALDGFTESPFAGDGAGGFRTRYLQDGSSDEQPRDAHSIPVEILGELGLPGILLFGAAMVGAVGGALRSRSLGPEAAFLTTAAITVWAVWFGQGAIDWFWSYAGMGAPMFALLGAAAAPQALSLRSVATKGRRRLGIFACVVVSASLLPLFLSERLTFDAADKWRSDPQGALRSLDRAADLNPFSDTPLLLKASIARQIGESEVSLAALEKARTRQPDEYLNYEYAARTLARDDLEAAKRELAIALRLNPLSDVLQRLDERIDARQDRPAGRRADG